MSVTYYIRLKALFCTYRTQAMQGRNKEIKGFLGLSKVTRNVINSSSTENWSFEYMPCVGFLIFELEISWIQTVGRWQIPALQKTILNKRSCIMLDFWTGTWAMPTNFPASIDRLVLDNSNRMVACCSPVHVQITRQSIVFVQLDLWPEIVIIQLPPLGELHIENNGSQLFQVCSQLKLRVCL